MERKKALKSVPGISREAEEEQLKIILARAQTNLENIQKYNKQLENELHEMLETYTNKDKEALTLWHNTNSQLQESKQELFRCEKARKKPYFGRIDFKDPSFSQDESYYIGRVGIADEEQNPLVIDWRAPISSVYYENNIGLCKYEVKNEGIYEIDLKRKRTYEIENDKLKDFFDSDIVANDDLLTKYLAKSKKQVLNEIIGTIQKEQNNIIRKTPKTNLIVQGAAGSGKTTVAMHRISYILYNYEDFRPEDFYIIGSNRILLNYITSVLPDLDVYGVSQMTMEELFVRLLYEDWDKNNYTIHAINKKDKKIQQKSTSQWFQKLEDFCAKYESDIIKIEDIKIPETDVLILEKERTSSYIKESPQVSMQGKINMLNEILLSRLDTEMTAKEVTYTKTLRKELQKRYKIYFGKDVWKGSIYELYHKFLIEQKYVQDYKENEYDLYDLAALAYIYKRIKETDGIREASHVIIDEAQDFGMMAYQVLEYCLRGCTYTIMGDISQNIQAGYGMDDWNELRALFIQEPYGSFEVLKKSYRNTVEIAKYATEILRHGDFSIYPIEPIIRHGNQVDTIFCRTEEEVLEETNHKLQKWKQEDYETIAVICRDLNEAAYVRNKLKKYLPIELNDYENGEFTKGIMVLPVEYTKGLEFDAVLLYNPTTTNYPMDTQHIKLLYVAATRALHELAVVSRNNLSEILAVPANNHKKNNILEVKVDLPKEKNCTKKQQKKAVNVPEKIVKIVEKIPRFYREKQEEQINQSAFTFGTVADTKILKPVHPFYINCQIKSVKKTKKFIDFISDHGILRLTPIDPNIIRIQFKEGKKPSFKKGYWHLIQNEEMNWSARQNQSHFQVSTEKMSVLISKKTGQLQFFDQDNKLLLAERNTEARSIEFLNGKNVFRNYFSWERNESLYAKGILDDNWNPLSFKARYISFGKKKLRMPLILSEKGYGIGIAAEDSVMCCNIPMYGNHIYTENMEQIDYYFIAGESKEKIISLYKEIVSY